MNPYAAPVVYDAGEYFGLASICTAAARDAEALVFVVGPVFVEEKDGWRFDVTGGTAAAAWRWLCVHDEAPHHITVIAVDAPGAEQGGPFAGLTVIGLRAVLRELESLLGVPWSVSTGVTVERLILSTHPRERGGVLLDREPQCPPPALGSALELPWSNWLRPLTPAELGRRFVHTFDANAQYLGAWQSVEMGFGEVAHLVDGPEFDPALVGFWRVPNMTATEHGDSLQPFAWLPDREWFTTATVRRTIEAAGHVFTPRVTEAYVWPSKSRFLRGAGERLRDARNTALTEISAARDLRGATAIWRAVLAAIKDCYRIGTGRLGWEGRAGSPWYRPDWGHEVRATARVNLHRRLEKLGAQPFAIATDGLAFASDDPSPAAFADRIGLPLHDGLGAFRVEGRCDLERVIRCTSASAVMREVARAGDGDA